ncbi:MAG: PHB depolymerase family esterase [Deltaproteobacteria bacterium]
MTLDTRIAALVLTPFMLWACPPPTVRGDAAADDVANDMPGAPADTAIDTVDEAPPVEAGQRDCGAIPDAGSAAYALTAETLMVGATARTYTLAAPAGSPPCGRSRALVLVFHGDGGAGGRTQHFLVLENTTAGEAVVVYPDGLPIPGSATGTASTWDTDTAAGTNRDVAFFDALVQSLTTRFGIDPHRVFATGLSRGAYFTNELGCVRGDVLRAIAPHSGGGPFAPTGDPDARYETYMGTSLFVCPTRASSVSAMVIHGAADPVVPPSEGLATRMHWEYYAGCSGERAAAAPAPCEASLGCTGNRRVLWCEIPGLTHQYWADVRTAVWGFFRDSP